MEFDVLPAPAAQDGRQSCRPATGFDALDAEYLYAALGKLRDKLGNGAGT